MASPLVDVQYPAAPRGQAPRVIQLRVRQHVFKHDVVVVKYFLERHTKNRYRNGSPITITFGYAPKGLQSFYGYVHHTETKSENNRHYLYVICIGTSYPMDEAVGVPSPRSTGVNAAGDATNNVIAKGVLDPLVGLITDTFADTLNGKTPAQVAVALGEDQGFDVVVDTPDDTIEAPRSWSSAGETKWKFLVRLAKSNGFVCFVNNATLYFFDPVKYLDRNQATFPVLKLNIQRVGNLAPIESFSILQSEDGNVHAHPGDTQDNRNHIVRSVDPRTGALITRTGAVPQRTVAGGLVAQRFSRTHQDTPAHTPGEAVQRANALVRANRWRTHAKVRAQGNSRLHQGLGVILQGVTAQDDGVWFVESVEHDLFLNGTNTTMSYMMDLELARDSTRRRVPKPLLLGRAIRPLVTAEQRTGRKQAKPVYRSGAWRSPFRRVSQL